MKGTLVIFVGPTGAGKNTIIRRLHDIMPVSYSVSATTRRRREGEINGINYWFVDRPEFNKMIASDKLVEYAEVYGEMYGTPYRSLEVALTQGIVLMDLDIVGAKNLMERFKYSNVGVITIFVQAGKGELVRRLNSRGDSKESIVGRLSQYEAELRQADYFDHVVLNDNLDRVVGEVYDIIKGREVSAGHQCKTG